MFKKSITLILTFLMIFSAFFIEPKMVFADSLSAAAVISNVTFNVNSSNNQVTVQGNISSGSGKNITLQVLDPDGTADYVKQITSSENGSFIGTFTISSVQEGNYTVKIGGEGITNPYVKTFTLSSTAQVTTPTASPKGGSVAAGTMVTLSSTTIGAAIYYTMDGNTPTASSTQYNGPIAVNNSMIIKAIAVKDGMTNSNIMSETYAVIIIPPETRNSNISPVTVKFDKNVNNQADLNVSLSLNGNSLISIKNGTYTLANGTDYIVNGTVVTIKKEYLLKLSSLGDTTLTFNFSAGNVQTMIVTIVDTTDTTSKGSKDNDRTTSGGTSNGGGSTTSGVQTETRTVDVVAGEQKESGITPVKVEITRTVERGTKVDTVKLDESKIAETITKAIENKKDIATVIVTDLKDNPADVVEVQISKTAASKLADKGIGLKVDTPKAKIEVPKETLGSVSGDIKFNINEVTDLNKISSTKGLVAKVNGDSKIIGNPVEIESNYKGRTEITIPIKTENLPKDPEELKRVLDSLSVYVEHSDGEKVTQKGEIVYDEKGNAVGISIWVDKFSTFTVVSLSQEGQKKANGDNNTNSTGSSNNAVVPEIKFVGLGHSPLVEGDKEDFIISSGFDGSVQYRIYLNVNGTWKEVTNGYSAAVSGKETFTLTPDYAFQKGQYQGRVYVKKAGNKGSKEENGIDYDNYYTYNINCVDRDDANRVYTTGKLNLSKDTVKAGEKVTITGVEGISGIEGPYFYRLHIYDVANDKWTNNVVPYSEKLEWTPSSAGTYVLDVHVITPNSVLWDNVQNDPTLIYGGYEGWKLETIKVN